MKLQISFDMTDINEAVTIAKKVEKYCDQIEVGSLLMYQYGVQAIKAFREALPGKTIVADTKIIDRGEEITKLIAHAGADWLTVMGGTSKHVLYAVARASKQHKIKVMVDLIDADSPGQTAMDAHAFGGDAILMHKPYDEDESLHFLDQWDLVRGNTKLPIFISAKINHSNIQKILKLNPDGIVVGRAITQADNPLQVAKCFYNLCKKQP